MIALSLDTWVSLGSILAVGLGLYAAVRGFRTELKTDIAGLRTELKGDIAGLRTELKADMAELRTEFKSDVAELRTELKTDIAGVHADLKADINRLDERIYLIAAGLGPRPVAEVPARTGS